ncbi:hypothetical protein Syun_020960 [Stephania yunnanensis]|uniref:Uncharacterized protein n=1 Tax=Stephania yunnanensis TaxID=152371 RepID=A0AAP0IEX0_9MAGN
MSYAAYKMMHWPTGIENCASGFIRHCGADFALQIPMVPSEDFETEVQEEDDNKGSRSLLKRSARFHGRVVGASLGARLPLQVLLNQYSNGFYLWGIWLHGNVETMAILPVEGGDNHKKRDSIILAFRDAKISILEFDDSIYGLRTRCYEMERIQIADKIALLRNFHMTPTNLFFVPSPIGGVLVISANALHYHDQETPSHDMPRSSFNVELDAANATWLSYDVAMLSAKTGELLLLTLVYDGRYVPFRSYANYLGASYLELISEEAILRDQEEREQLERNIRNRDAAATKKGISFSKV